MATRTRLFKGTENLGETSLPCGVELEVHRCGTCGVIWGLEATFMKARRDDHEEWQCPNGHSFVFNGPSEEEKLRKELERERDRSGRIASQRDQLEASLRGERIAKSRFKNERDRLKMRVAHGVCPCCNRTFKQLSRHMETKHPEFVAESRAS